jgi:hypothetical protein
MRTLILWVFKIDVGEYVRGGAQHAISNAIVADITGRKQFLGNHYYFVCRAVPEIVQYFVDSRFADDRAGSEELAMWDSSRFRIVRGVLFAIRLGEAASRLPNFVRPSAVNQSLLPLLRLRLLVRRFLYATVAKPTTHASILSVGSSTELWLIGADLYSLSPWHMNSALRTSSTRFHSLSTTRN